MRVGTRKRPRVDKHAAAQWRPNERRHWAPTHTPPSSLPLLPPSLSSFPSTLDGLIGRKFYSHRQCPTTCAGWTPVLGCTGSHYHYHYQNNSTKRIYPLSEPTDIRN